MSRTHACALSWHLKLSLASPAESGMTIILERLCIIQLKPYAREINHICNRVCYDMEVGENRVRVFYGTITVYRSKDLR